MKKITNGMRSSSTTAKARGRGIGALDAGISEQELQKAILDYLRMKGVLCFKHRNVGIRKPSGSYIPLPQTELGISDIIGCMPEDGRFLAIEVKRKGQKPTQMQQDFLDRVSRNNGIGFVAHSLDDVMERVPVIRRW